jgi:bis(5'-nucleosidyl)-tetraphosphatase
MNIEKSCGAVIYRKLGEEFEFLVVKSKANGHWSFPKGHMEKDESEKETARREVLEETGLNIILLDEFRTKIEYQLTESTLKEVILFIGITSAQSVNIQQEEIEEFKWLNYKEMLDLLTFENSKKILIEVKNFLNNSAS